MKKISILSLLVILTFCSINAFGQKGSKPVAKKRLRTLVQPLPKAKIEIENWKVFEGKDLHLKMSFPKEPTVTVTDKVSYESAAVNSAIVQTYINGTFYMVEVREYPENLLPDRVDLSKSYGNWMKTFILNDIKLIGEKTYDYEIYKVVEFTYQQTETDVLIHRAVVIGKNLYQMIVQLEIKKPDNREQAIAKNAERIKMFFDSFEITEKSFNNSTIY